MVMMMMALKASLLVNTFLSVSVNALNTCQHTHNAFPTMARRSVSLTSMTDSLRRVSSVNSSPCIKLASKSRSTLTVEMESRTRLYASMVSSEQDPFDSIKIPTSISSSTSTLKTKDSSTRLGASTTSEQTLFDPVRTADIREFSYSEQYDDLFSQKQLVVNKPVPKPDEAAQVGQPKAKKIPFSRVYGVLKRNRFFNRPYGPQDITYGIFFFVLHSLCFFAPQTFSWKMLGLAFVTYFATGCMGITFSFHRQLSHRSFQTPKWLEYTMAYLASWAIQGDPVTWVSDHRYHHLHTDTPLDLHSPYEGFWWSHMGWMFDEEAHDKRAPTMSNASDLLKQPFYQHMKKFYFVHIMLKLAFMYAIGGFPGLVWGGAVATVFLWHVTFFVNSASHVWGNQPFRTGDLSRNIWWVGILAFGEGWHNNHHAFEFSARHGLFKNQIDVTYSLISLLQRLNLAYNVKLPNRAQIDRLKSQNGNLNLAFQPA